jgi:hypothetical protein
VVRSLGKQVQEERCVRSRDLSAALSRFGCLNRWRQLAERDLGGSRFVMNLRITTLGVE